MPAWGYLNEQQNLRNTNMNTKATQIGNQAEKYTMNLLDTTFATHPNIYVFHDLNIPTNDGRSIENANIDHLILTGGPHGTRGIIIDSKAWKAGTYKTKKGTTYRGKEKFPAADTHTIDMAADRYTAAATNQGIQITWDALYIIWPTNTDRTTLRGIRHNTTTPNLTKPVYYIKGNHAKHLIAALTTRPQPITQQTINLFYQYVRTPIRYNNMTAR